MDNATHTLIGLAVARQLEPRGSQADHASLAWAAAIASNLPDGDVIMIWIFRLLGESPTRLDALLNHRAETHTLFFVLPASLILTGGVARFFGKPLSWRLYCASILGLLLHLFADSWNNYGVHPFAPFSGRLFSQDFIFILEPLLFFALWPWGWHASSKWISKGLWILLGGTVLFAAIKVGGLPDTVRIFIFVWAALMVSLQARKLQTRLGWSFVLLVLGSFYGTSHQAMSFAQESWERITASEKPLQWIGTPQPANPLCWNVQAVSVDSQGQYHIRRAAVSLGPQWFSPRSCSIHSGATTAPLHTLSHLSQSEAQSSKVLWLDEFRAPLKEGFEIASRDCRAAAFLRFSRAPFWTQDQGEWVMGDLRYDRERKLSFSEFKLDSSARCPIRVPIWDSMLLRVL